MASTGKSELTLVPSCFKEYGFCKKGMPWLEVGSGGAEYGALRWKDGEKAPKLGDRLDVYCTNLDQSTNAFDRYYIAQGDKIVDVWPIMGRAGATQR